jgi:hypothetical protein
MFLPQTRKLRAELRLFFGCHFRRPKPCRESRLERSPARRSIMRNLNTACGVT